MAEVTFVVNFYDVRDAEVQLVDSVYLPTEELAIEAAKIGCMARAGAMAMHLADDHLVSILRTSGSVPRSRLSVP